MKELERERLKKKGVLSKFFGRKVKTKDGKVALGSRGLSEYPQAFQKDFISITTKTGDLRSKFNENLKMLPGFKT
jgi:hypothetical protein